VEEDIGHGVDALCGAFEELVRRAVGAPDLGLALVGGGVDLDTCELGHGDDLATMTCSDGMEGGGEGGRRGGGIGWWRQEQERWGVCSGGAEGLDERAESKGRERERMMSWVEARPEQLSRLDGSERVSGPSAPKEQRAASSESVVGADAV
jgi:hypothetical protein